MLTYLNNQRTKTVEVRSARVASYSFLIVFLVQYLSSNLQRQSQMDFKPTETTETEHRAFR